MLHIFQMALFSGLRVAGLPESFRGSVEIGNGSLGASAGLVCQNCLLICICPCVELPEDTRLPLLSDLTLSQ